jgi:hypothetical protein
MKHHFGDSLDRRDRHWTIVPNRERYAYRIDNLPAGEDDTAKIVTLGRDDADWKRVLSMTAVEELTLHQPSPEQFKAVEHLPQLRRLRITHARPKSIDCLASLCNLEELVLEYVSGFSDLSPLAQLPRLRSLHLENLRKVADHSGLSGAAGLQYLSIHGTVDWKQPIKDFEFLHGLPSLQVFALWQVICKAPFPALLPLARLKSLKRVRIADELFATEEYALLQAALPEVEGTDWEPFTRYAYSYLLLADDDPRSGLSDEELRVKHPEVRVLYDGRREVADPNTEWFLFLGKGAGRVKCTSPKAADDCEAFRQRFEAMKVDSNQWLRDR